MTVIAQVCGVIPEVLLIFTTWRYSCLAKAPASRTMYSFSAILLRDGTATCRSEREGSLTVSISIGTAYFVWGDFQLVHKSLMLMLTSGSTMTVLLAVNASLDAANVSDAHVLTQCSSVDDMLPPEQV